MTNKLFKISLVIIVLAVAALYIMGKKSEDKPMQPNTIAESALTIYKDAEFIDWIFTDDNNAYIGFNLDLFPYESTTVQGLCNAMALLVNKRTNFGFHVWAYNSKIVKKEQVTRKSITDYPYIYETTARHGQIE